MARDCRSSSIVPATPLSAAARESGRSALSTVKVSSQSPQKTQPTTLSTGPTQVLSQVSEQRELTKGPKPSENSPSSKIHALAAKRTDKLVGGLSMKKTVAVQTLRGIEPLTVKIDTGADVSCLNESLAVKLGWDVKPVSPIEAFGSTSAQPIKLTQATEQMIRLCDDAPLRLIKFYVHEDVLPGNANYALVGLADLVDFTLSLEPDKLVLEYHGVSEMPEAELMPEVEIGHIIGVPPVTIGDQLNEEQRRVIEQLVSEYSDIFQPLDTQPANLEPFSIHLKPTAIPRCLPSRWFVTIPIELEVKEEKTGRLGEKLKGKN